MFRTDFNCTCQVKICVSLRKIFTLIYAKKNIWYQLRTVIKNNNKVLTQKNRHQKKAQKKTPQQRIKRNFNDLI